MRRHSKAVALSALAQNTDQIRQILQSIHDNIDTEWEDGRSLVKRLTSMSDVSDRDKIGEYFNRSASSMIAGLNLIHQALIKFEDAQEDLGKAQGLIDNTRGDES